jgi:transcriptional regulator with XRE-family HTH domain
MQRVTTTCFRLFLETELARRRARNPRYSLRAFAKRLAVDHSTLSQWMRGRRAIPTSAIETLGRRLQLTPKAVRVFVGHNARGPALSEVEGPDLHILQLTRREGFRADSRWIARELRVSVDEANIALHRLLRFDLLQMKDANRWIDMSEVP